MPGHNHSVFTKEYTKINRGSAATPTVDYQVDTLLEALICFLKGLVYPLRTMFSFFPGFLTCNFILIFSKHSVFPETFRLFLLHVPSKWGKMWDKHRKISWELVEGAIRPLELLPHSLKSSDYAPPNPAGNGRFDSWRNYAKETLDSGSTTGTTESERLHIHWWHLRPFSAFWVLAGRLMTHLTQTG